MQSCAGPYREWPGRESWKGRGGGRGRTSWGSQCGVCEGSCGTAAVWIYERDPVEGARYDTDLVAEEAARNVYLLAPYNDNLLAVENLLRDNRSQPTKKMALAINDDGGRGEGGHGESSGRGILR